MTIKTIQVSAGRTFNHPHEDYSNLRPGLTLTAELLEGEDPHVATKTLQQIAEGLIEDHKQAMLKSIEELWEMSRMEEQARGLERQLKQNQELLDELRRRKAEILMKPPEITAGTPDDTPVPPGCEPPKAGNPPA